MDKIRVGVIGAYGRMGQASCQAIARSSDLELVWAIDLEGVREPIPGTSLTIESDFSPQSPLEKAQVLLDFTHPSVAASHAVRALQAGVAPIVGTSGLSTGDLQSLSQLSEEAGVPALVIPNFAIGAVLMIQFAALAARWLPECEIIELHHERKVDAPSGTAEYTAEKIAEARQGHLPPPRDSLLRYPGARGAKVHGVPIHSIRLPGKLAHQMVILGAPGETLTLQHDSTDRSSFMPGVLLAIRKVLSRQGLAVGLENLLDL
ncbi:MAG TPA: 4-hydroxy-tetrahydrodipicolinate reductase [Fimbriimonadaceae bacterium]|nr:4-hydroxy-tetrahydrodipicolinate reductase [Fimbriimonadaceae bacterium]HRJ33781.1 4-hydroxy-tetrahydrodipicolinate reductase [Fimbriimonadaceae bacterium]